MSEIDIELLQTDVVVQDLASTPVVFVSTESPVAAIEVTGEVRVNVSDLSPVPIVTDPSQVIRVEINLAGTQGPQGPAGSGGSEEDMAYKKLVDFIDENTFYVGQAQPGTATSSPLWRIKKVTIAIDGDVAELWANGSGNFDNIWDNRTILTYS